MKLKLHRLEFKKKDVYLNLRKKDFDGEEVVLHLSGVRSHIPGFNLSYISSNGLFRCNGVGSCGNFINGVDIDTSHRDILKIIGVDEL